MSITIMGKTIGHETDYQKQINEQLREKRKKEAQARQAQKEARRQASEQARLAREQHQFDIEQARRERAEKKYKSIAEIEKNRAEIAKAKTKEALHTKRRRSESYLASVARGVSGGVKSANRGLVGLKTGGRSRGSSRRETLYRSTSHGLKKVNQDEYYGSGAIPQGRVPPRIKSDDDDWGQAGAFSGF